MHELSDVPENSLGQIQAISNTSASALQITYQPLYQQANLKAMQYGEGITAINTMILRIMDIENPDDERLTALKEAFPNYRREIYIEPIFAYGFPKDKMDELQRAQLELQMKLGSRREIMERLGKQNIPQLLQEIDDDAMQQAVVNMEIQKIALQAQVPPMGGEEGGSSDEDNNQFSEENAPNEEEDLTNTEENET